MSYHATQLKIDGQPAESSTFDTIDAWWEYHDDIVRRFNNDPRTVKLYTMFHNHSADAACQCYEYSAGDRLSWANRRVNDSRRLPGRPK